MAKSSYPRKNGKVSAKTQGTLKLKPYDLEAIAQAYSLLNKDHPTQLTTEALALAIGINRNKLHYGFKQLYGLTIYEFRKQQAMKKAKELLINSAYPVKTIATLVGYSSSSDFGSAFKMHLGLTPTAYRKQKPTTEDNNSNEAA